MPKVQEKKTWIPIYRTCALHIRHYTLQQSSSIQINKPSSLKFTIRFCGLWLCFMWKINLLPRAKSITFSPNLPFLLVLSHHVRLHPFSLFLFFSIIIFSLLFTTLFLWNNAMNTTNFTNWCVINHKKNSFKHLFIILFKCHTFLSH